MSVVRQLFVVAAVLAVLVAGPTSARADDAASDTDPVKLYSGAALVTTGGLATIGGTISYFALSASTDDSCIDARCTDPYKGAKTASIVTLLLGGAGLAAGITLLLTADASETARTKRRRRGRSASITPTSVTLGAGSAAATWSF